jgi:hypothetical protein
MPLALMMEAEVVSEALIFNAAMAMRKIYSIPLPLKF